MTRTTKLLRKRWLRVGLLIALLMLLSQSLAAAQFDDRPRMRIVNGATEVGTVDVFIQRVVDGQPVNQATLLFPDVQFGYVTKYVALETGQEYDIIVRPNDSEDTIDGQPPTRIRFEANQDWTVAVTDNPTRRIFATTDARNGRNREQLIFPGRAEVRFFNIASELPPVQACFEDNCWSVEFLQDPFYIQTLDPAVSPREEASKFGIEAGTYNLNVRVIGLERLYLAAVPITFQAGYVYTVFFLAPGPDQEEQKPLVVIQIDAGLTSPTPGCTYPCSPGGGGNAAPLPPPAAPPAGGNLPPPVYPPLTGAFLSTEAQLVVGGLGLLLLTGIGWAVRRRSGR